MKSGAWSEIRIVWYLQALVCAVSEKIIYPTICMMHVGVKRVFSVKWMQETPYVSNTILRKGCTQKADLDGMLPGLEDEYPYQDPYKG